MEYKYPPIFKYIILLICIFMFIKHLKIMINQQNLIMTITIILFVIIFDYVLINNHANLLETTDETFINSSVTDDIVDDKDIEEILSSYDTENSEEELDNDESALEYPNTNQRTMYQLPTDYKKPSYGTNTDCYKRGDGRGNNTKTQRYYTKDVL